MAVKEGLAGWLWEGSQQTACTCQVLRGQPEPQSRLARLTPFRDNLHPGTVTGGGTFQADSGHLGV